METAVLVAIITGVCAVLGQYMIARANKKQQDTERAVHDALISQRLDTIERKLDEHNGYAQRFEEVAVSIAELRTELHTRGAA